MAAFFSAESLAPAILEAVSDGVFVIDLSFRVRWMNAAAERITGVPRGEALGRPCREVFKAEICGGGCALAHTIETGEEVVDRRIRIVRSDGERIPISISTALLRDAAGEVVGGVETFRDLSLLERLRRKVEAREGFCGIVSRNVRMQRLFSLLPELAAVDTTVLLEGESGTGKELFARAIHRLGPRRGGPFLVVNCAALPESLAESELFGYEKGAFTGAHRDRTGRIAVAQGGTLLLDEIGELPLPLQAKLLRVLQHKVIEPVGSDEPRRVDVRFIAATNRDLAAECAAGRFREDLYWRLNVVKLTIPPLRARIDDIPLLVEHFIEKLNERMEKRMEGVDQEAMRLLLSYHWPGNVRQLEAVLEHAFVVGTPPLIRPQDLPAEVISAHAPLHSGRLILPDSSACRPPEPDGRVEFVGAPLPSLKLEELERMAVAAALERCGGSRKKAAAELGISKATLWRKMKRYGFI